VVWVIAGTYYLLQATHIFSFASSSWLHLKPSEASLAQDLGRYVDFVQQHEGIRLPQGVRQRWAGGRTPEELEAFWPYRSISPKKLACDAAGRNLLVVDGMSVYKAEVSSRTSRRMSTVRPLSPSSRQEEQQRFLGPASPTPPRNGADDGLSEETDDQVEAAPAAATFTAQPGCAELLGKTLQDAELVCDARTCEALVLHSRGRQITSCPLQAAIAPTPGAGSGLEPTSTRGSEALPLMQHWLEPSEKVVALSLDANCDARGLKALQSGCGVVQTSFGRQVQLQVTSSGSLAPKEEVHLAQRGGGGGRASEAAAAEGPPLHCVGGGYLYLLGRGRSPALWRVQLPSARDEPSEASPRAASEERRGTRL